MEKIKSVGALPEVESHEPEELRCLADHELRLVGGGDDVPGWTPPK